MENNELNKQITPNTTDIKQKKIEHKAALKALKSQHDAELAEIKKAQVEELKVFKEAQVEQKKLAAKVKAEVKEENAKFFAKKKADFEVFKAQQAKAKEEFVANHDNLVEIYKFDQQQKAEAEAFAETKRNEELFFVSNQKNKVNKVDLNWQNEVVKFRLNQFETFHRREDVLRYDEYLLEQKQKEEIDALLPSKQTGDSKNALKDADKEEGNPVAIFFKHLWRDLKYSIINKPSIIFGLLVMFTGVIFGFTINKFIRIAYNFTAEYAYVGMLIFIFELAAVFNMVNGFGMCSSRRLKSVVNATIATIIMLVTGIIWIYSVNYRLTGASDLELGPETVRIIILCLVTSIIGVIGGYFTYDREYLKVRR